MEKDKNVYEAPWLIPVTTIVTGASLDTGLGDGGDDEDGDDRPPV